MGYGWGNVHDYGRGTVLVVVAASEMMKPMPLFSRASIFTLPFSLHAFRQPYKPVKFRQIPFLILLY